MRGRKAQGMSINTIILIVLALIVLAVLIYMIANKTTLFGKAAEGCESRQGSCVTNKDDCAGPTIEATTCPSQSFCCIGKVKEGVTSIGELRK
mgnify:CR=1 FL=1